MKKLFLMPVPCLYVAATFPESTDYHFVSELASLDETMPNLARLVVADEELSFEEVVTFDRSGRVVVIGRRA